MNAHPSKNKSLDVISVTERNQFKLCRRNWDWSKAQRYEEERIPDALWFGTAIHAGVEAYYASGHDWAAIETAYRASVDASKNELGQTFAYDLVIKTIDKQFSLGLEMLENYRTYDHAVTLEHWDIHSLEQRHYVDVLGPGTPQLTGQIDLLVMINGEYWVVDHKSFARKTNQQNVDTLDQLTAYCYIVREVMGVTPTGAILNVLLKKLPSERVKKKYNWFDAYFQRLYTERTDAQLDAFGRYLKVEFAEMMHVYAHPELAIPSTGYQCANCSFRNRCLGALPQIDVVRVTGDARGDSETQFK